LRQALALSLLRAIGRQRFVDRGKIRLLHMLASPEKLASQRFTTGFFGLRYSGDVSNWIDWNVYFAGAYEPEFLKLLADMVAALRRRGRTVHYVDVGANVGHHALFMSRLADRVTAFEPFPRVADEIRTKIAENGLTNLQLFPVALGDADGELAIQLLDDANLGTATLTADRVGRTGRTAVGTAQVRAGDAFFESNALPPIDILKVDVEGFEAAVFGGLRARILADRPIILTEISGPDHSGFGSPGAFRAALYPDHRLYSVRPRRGRYELEPFDLGGEEVLCVPEEFAPDLA
jgi:FkbM family methyltransferase